MSDYAVYLKTVQSNAIRVLFEALKDVLIDVNLNVSSKGIRVISMDGSKSSIVQLKLQASNFEVFECQSPQSLGINLMSMFKIIKSVKNSDVITLYVYNNDLTILFVKIENSDKQTEIVSEVKLLDIDETLLSIPDIEFDTTLTLPSSDFQSYIRDLSVISDEIKIRSTENKLIFYVSGDFASQTISITQSKSGLTLNKCGDSEGVFNIKYILLFTKSTNLCNNVELYIKQNYPLVLVYTVANLGHLKFCLAPKQS